MERINPPRCAQEQAGGRVPVDRLAGSTNPRSGRATFLHAMGVVIAVCGAWARAESSPDMELAAAFPLLEQITVTASRIDLLGTADTASVGVVADEEIQLTPAYRPGQLVETVPGLIVTLHSGEGKANRPINICCAATTWITARISRPTSTTSPSTNRPTRTARATRT
jgi:hypothetical protein